MRNRRRRRLCAGGLALLSAFAATAFAQTKYPSRPIRVVVPYTPGGITDVATRMVMQEVAKSLGQNVIIDNRPGANSIIGVEIVAKAAPDGYTLLLYHIGVATFGALYPDLAYKPGEAFDPVGLVTEVPMTLAGRKDLPPANVTALLDWLKGVGGGATFGTAGVGAVSDLCGRLLTDAAGIKLTMVPYRGTGPAMNDLVGGRLDLMCDQTTNTANQIKEGQIKPYAVTTRERIAILPEVPTLAESGVQGFDISAWHAIWAPKGTPEPIRQKLAAALRKALTNPTVIDRFAALGTAPVPAEMATPAALDARFKSELVRWNKLLAGASPQ
jgi:tripartite-type tricarboxylate transporter receptor subunit TctC